MKTLLKSTIFSGILLIASVSLNASEIYLSKQKIKDYSVSVKLHDKLKLGHNEFNAKILYKSIPINNANVSFELFKPNGELVKYTSKTLNNNKNYTFNVELKEKGEYTYLIVFNKMDGGVTRYSRGSFEL